MIFKSHRKKKIPSISYKTSNTNHIFSFPENMFNIFSLINRNISRNNIIISFIWKNILRIVVVPWKSSKIRKSVIKCPRSVLLQMPTCIIITIISIRNTMSTIHKISSSNSWNLCIHRPHIRNIYSISIIKWWNILCL